MIWDRGDLIFWRNISSLLRKRIYGWTGIWNQQSARPRSLGGGGVQVGLNGSITHDARLGEPLRIADGIE
jgi:hypothetical protein